MKKNSEEEQEKQSQHIKANQFKTNFNKSVKFQSSNNNEELEALNLDG